MFNTIVAAVDGSDSSDNALEIAAELSAKFDANLHIVNVPQDDTAALISAGYAGYAGVAGLKPAKHYKEIGEKIVSRAEQAAKAKGANQVTTHVLSGEPANIIVKLSDDQNADLIVSGRRGLGNVKGLLLGSTSQKVASGAKCAFLSAQ